VQVAKRQMLSLKEIAIGKQKIRCLSHCDGVLAIQNSNGELKYS
jgi:hypothetical protein